MSQYLYQSVWTCIKVFSEHILCTERIVLFELSFCIFTLSVSPAYFVFSFVVSVRNSTKTESELVLKKGSTISTKRTDCVTLTRER